MQARILPRDDDDDDVEDTATGTTAHSNADYTPLCGMTSPKLRNSTSNYF